LTTTTFATLAVDAKAIAAAAPHSIALRIIPAPSLQIRQKIEFPQQFAAAESDISVALATDYARIEPGSINLI
jgi:hypothetical protein